MLWLGHGQSRLVTVCMILLFVGEQMPEQKFSNIGSEFFMAFVVFKAMAAQPSCQGQQKAKGY